jgi:hypothetical protein
MCIFYFYGMMEVGAFGGTGTGGSGAGGGPASCLTLFFLSSFSAHCIFLFFEGFVLPFMYDLRFAPEVRDFFFLAFLFFFHSHLLYTQHQVHHRL